LIKVIKQTFRKDLLTFTSSEPLLAKLQINKGKEEGIALHPNKKINKCPNNLFDRT